MVQTRSQTGVAECKVYVNENNEMEVNVWGIRNEMTGMKNVKMELLEKITEVLSEIETVDKVLWMEVKMDILKFKWKCVLKGLMTLEAFKNEVKVSEFYEDFENLIANFMMCEKCEKFNKVLEVVKMNDGMLPSTLGLKVGKFTLLPTNPKTKDEYVKIIKYTITKTEESKSQKVFWCLQAIEYGVNFVINFDNIGRFKKTVISKIEEFIEEPKLNENQKARLRFYLIELEN